MNTQETANVCTPTHGSPQRASSSQPPARHEFDYLPADGSIEVRPATLAEISAIAAMARKMVPGIQIDEQGLLKHHLHDEACVLVLAKEGRLLGGTAFLYLNKRGHDALMSGALSTADPDFSFLAARDEPVAAIYFWAIGAVGRGIAGLGKISAHLRHPRYANADCYAQPATAAGRDLMIAAGFRPIASSQPDLWLYERPWKRFAGLVVASHQSARSNTDEKH